MLNRVSIQFADLLKILCALCVCLVFVSFVFLVVDSHDLTTSTNAILLLEMAMRLILVIP